VRDRVRGVIGAIAANNETKGGLKKKGIDIQPVETSTRKIAHTFWGKAWCDHIESFSDFDNRLPRGRTYIRNGSVCHLAIAKGKIDAIVSGSALYNVNITINPLAKKKWKDIKTTCAGQIGSLIDLLNGQLSDGVMEVVCDRHKGLFPTPQEIHLSCDCPDWATMCKHVAAVLYGVGVRLDEMPAQLFLLRGVDHDELVDVSAAVMDATQGDKTKRKHIVDSALPDVFGIELAGAASVRSTSRKAKSKAARSGKTKKTATKASKSQQSSQHKRVTAKISRKKAANPRQTKSTIHTQTTFPKYLTGASIRKKRKALDLTQTAFAHLIEVSAATVSQWEAKGRKRLNPRKETIKSLHKIWL